MEITSGIDIVDIERFENTLQRYGSRFLKRVYTERELKGLPEKDRSFYIAASFSFKEAIWKALPDEKQKLFYFRDIEILWKKGIPYPVLKGEDSIPCLTLNFFRKGKNIITTAIIIHF
ncbi:MAG: 4'-phosphopantetheinyl transferase superfamily protein [Candidatus Omnitrophica bacterium]|nr:4'-phosphopantetheinyl transferase superfamily protein [Candidatus Omnitrophota bacterium]MCM8777592.1 4'-phosphopantetheinyl transferase superfamily protein [Candidatus Omnitrophota bacterium]